MHFSVPVMRGVLRGLILGVAWSLALRKHVFGLQPACAFPQLVVWDCAPCAESHQLEPAREVVTDLLVDQLSDSPNLHLGVAPAESNQGCANIVLLRTHHGLRFYNSRPPGESSFFRRDTDSFRQQLAGRFFQSRYD